MDNGEIKTIHVVLYTTGNDGRPMEGKGDSPISESGGHSSFIEMNTADQVRTGGGDV
jgi:hypothetical protein